MARGTCKHQVQRRDPAAGDSLHDHGGEFARRLGFAVPLTDTKTTGIVRCDRPRVLDLAARNARKVETLPTPLLDEVLARVATIFE